MKRNLILSAFLAIGTLALVQGDVFAQTSTTSTSMTGATDSSLTGISNIPRPATSLVDVQDQFILDNKVRVRQADAPDIGWLSIYENVDGRPGDLLGYVNLDTGANKNLLVPISRQPKTKTAFAVVHSGLGPQGRVVNTLGRYDPISYPIAKSPRSAMASFNIYPYRTGYVNVNPSVSSSMIDNTTSAPTP